ncbi:MAG TPA: zinc ribbon domain-containing protein [Verrucomicrobiae bacterium]|nr:zinc ribbon domain-containing protein [Verrucomicrobiae bacterium]
MPLYEFVCAKCERDFESLVRSSKWEGSVACPHCGSTKLTKKLSVFAAQGGGATSSASAPSACGRTGGCCCGGGKHHH